MQFSNGSYLFLQVIYSASSPQSALVILIWLHNFLIHNVNFSSAKPVATEVTLCSDDSISVDCTSGHRILFTAASLRPQNSTTNCTTSNNTTSQGDCTSNISLLRLNQECRGKHECEIENISPLLTDHACSNTTVVLEYICVVESNVLNLCDETLPREISLNEEGIIILPEDISSDNSGNSSLQSNRDTTNKTCNLFLTPVHGQFLHFDLIPLSMEDSEPPCSPASSHVAVTASGFNLRLCPSAAADRVLLKSSSFVNASISLENQSAVTTQNTFVIFYKAQGCTTISIPIVNNDTATTEYSYGTRAVIECLKGHKMSSDTGVFTCRDGQWFGVRPNCTELVCAPVKVPVGGVVEYKAEQSGQGEVHTHCEEGYALTGDSVRICFNNTWNGTQASCLVVSCGSLPTIPNGEVTYSALGNTATYTCITGYWLLGQASRTCQENSQWNGSEPKCSRIVCGHPGAPEHGRADPAKQSDYPTGTVITYTCAPGYNLTGAAEIVCNETGSWSASPPVCNMIDCGIPPEVLFANPVFNRTTFKAKVTFTCTSGSVDSEPVGYLLCTVNGTWQGTLPQCQGVLPNTVPSNSTVSATSEPNTQEDNTLDHPVNTSTTVISAKTSVVSSTAPWTTEENTKPPKSLSTTRIVITTITSVVSSNASWTTEKISNVPRSTSRTTRVNEQTTKHLGSENDISYIPQTVLDTSSTSKPTTSETFQPSPTTVQYSSTPALSPVRNSGKSNNSIKHGLIGGAIAFGALLVLLLLWLLYIFKNRRKVRLRRPDELTCESSGFFDQALDIYDHAYTYAYAEKFQRRSQQFPLQPNETRQNGQNGQKRSPCELSLTKDLMNSTSPPQHYCSHQTSSTHKLNGSVRSNGSVPHPHHQSFRTHSSIENVHRNEKYETSRI